MHRDHLASHIKHKKLNSDNTLYVIGVCSNVARFHSRYRLARKWMEHMASTPNVQLCIVEAAFGDHKHEITDKHNPWHLQVKIHTNMWLKENMMNLAVRHLFPHDWKYCAWVDMDVFFEDKHWAQDCMNELQKFAVIQPWSDCIDLGPTGNILTHFRSFGHQHQKKIPKQTHPMQPYALAHPGFAWSCTREFYENLPGGFMWWPPLGSADFHQAFACIGQVEYTIYKGLAKSFHRLCNEWQQRAVRITHNQVGFISGFIKHGFHGPKAKRYYLDRVKLLVKYGYDPDKHIKWDHQGLPFIFGLPGLEHEMHLYGLSRSEDSIEEI